MSFDFPEEHFYGVVNFTAELAGVIIGAMSDIPHTTFAHFGG